MWDKYSFAIKHITLCYHLWLKLCSSFLSMFCSAINRFFCIFGNKPYWCHFFCAQYASFRAIVIYHSGGNPPYFTCFFQCYIIYLSSCRVLQFDFMLRLYSTKIFCKFSIRGNNSFKITFLLVFSFTPHSPSLSILDL